MKFAATLLLASAAAIKLNEPEEMTLDEVIAEIDGAVDDAIAVCEADPELSGCDDLAWALACEDDPEMSGCDDLAELEAGLEACVR